MITLNATKRSYRLRTVERKGAVMKTILLKYLLWSCLNVQQPVLILHLRLLFLMGRGLGQPCGVPISLSGNFNMAAFL